MFVSSPMRCVTAAETASEMNESWLGKAIRSIVARLEKPRCSAAIAHCGSSSGQSGMGFEVRYQFARQRT